MKNRSKPLSQGQTSLPKQYRARLLLKHHCIQAQSVNRSKRILFSVPTPKTPSGTQESNFLPYFRNSHWQEMLQLKEPKTSLTMHEVESNPTPPAAATVLQGQQTPNSHLWQVRRTDQEMHTTHAGLGHVSSHSCVASGLPEQTSNKFR